MSTEAAVLARRNPLHPQVLEHDAISVSTSDATTRKSYLDSQRDLVCSLLTASLIKDAKVINRFAKLLPIPASSKEIAAYIEFRRSVIADWKELHPQDPGGDRQSAFIDVIATAKPANKSAS